ncbi:lipoyl(octanoyl) transferase LipB [Celerinatantimonas diazotrophica]|uniref:Octanoyltransferase n=1 Tax=Celerinatantimonas diazotrophica TaxID=412034 RepID=A0A4V2PRF7_9GAMM|nr:lipoyl(octanoyl) transferase LipB [Celerinatantimonas diazotrophica]TCK58651.1 lipoyl(octanoyl) transferase [Celerinatantimonas diazotrophica]CAG9297280.1 Octanoyltransferase [Celerinatantimonas diazotrophica]
MTKQCTDIKIVRWGLVDYQPMYQRMHEFTEQRDETTQDQIWLVEHPPIFTQGQAGKPEHLLNPGQIPVFQADRGGQVTYHGPGQMIAYLMLDLRRRKLGVRALVSIMEQAVVNTLAQYHIAAYPKADAPGVYVNDAKIASLGLRVRRGCSFHGLALNVNMDLNPFHQINPCGYAGLEMTQTSDLGGPTTVTQASETFLPILVGLLGATLSEEQLGTIS